MNNYCLENIINKKLNAHLFHDIACNGLQIPGYSNIYKIVIGVSICKPLIDFAIQYRAQAIIVHHGLFVQNESYNMRMLNQNRINLLLKHNINLYSWHLPLDVHEKLGNNVQLAKKLGINVLGKISDVILWGAFPSYITIQNLFNRIKKKLYRDPLCFNHLPSSKIHTIAWCSGRGQKFIEQIYNLKLDVFLTGEASEDTMHYIYENNMIFFSAGHYATERYGVQALGQWISKKYSLDVVFVDINNPI
ncbi:Nif3-like dinuclear metal center hexameric protein [Buchnera aphidicola]|uniref:Nif3-like dinuclear metal center hexameric protein n=1 Tax=Buchnera aphidicola (Stegophylla sp.) TaxID=2315800 RepID=A0A4D6YBQ4_9GAMM|nr:Nif3-like dinuclear metal center hexameric protein [Buchnera aphidicola (Stegophylla sp.)]QCI26542.1 Nif3-like dinuclear metal center hexameric protein [Buchnera aphidicola (Stegophylla sp.)]